MEYPQVQALFSHPNLKAITLQQPLADAMILGKKKVRALGCFVLHALCLRTSAGGWWCGQPPAATRSTVFKNCTRSEVSGRRLACCPCKKQGQAMRLVAETPEGDADISTGRQAPEGQCLPRMLTQVGS